MKIDKEVKLNKLEQNTCEIITNKLSEYGITLIKRATKNHRHTGKDFQILEIGVSEMDLQLATIVMFSIGVRDYSELSSNLLCEKRFFAGDKKKPFYLFMNLVLTDDSLNIFVKHE